MIIINRKSYVPMRMVLDNEINSILVCRKADVGEPYYTVIVVKKREVRKEILGALEDWQGKGALLELESQQNALYLVFPNRRDRLVGSFLPVHAGEGEACLTLCRCIVMESMTLSLPVFMIYLLMRNSCINVDAEGRPYFNYYMDLASCRQNVSQADCVMALAELLEGWLRRGAQNRALGAEKALELISKKSIRKMHRDFPTLYKDLEMAGGGRGPGLRDKLHLFFFRKKDVLFRIGKIIAIGCFFTALLLFLNQLLFSDLTLLFRYTGMEQVGTVILR